MTYMYAVAFLNADPLAVTTGEVSTSFNTALS